MRIKFSAANIAINITDNDGNIALDYSIKEINVEGNMATFIKAMEEINADMTKQMESAGFDIGKALANIGGKPN